MNSERLILAAVFFFGGCCLFYGLQPPSDVKPPDDTVIVDPDKDQQGDETAPGDILKECVAVTRTTVAAVLRESLNHDKAWAVENYKRALIESFKPLGDKIAEARWNEANVESVARNLELGTL